MRLWSFGPKEQRFSPISESAVPDTLPRENWHGDRMERRGHAGIQAAAATIGGVTVLTGCATTMTDANAASSSARVLMDGQERVRVTLAPRNASPEQKYQHYARIIRAAGGTINANGATVLGLRGLDLGGTVRETRVRTDFVDTFVVLKRSASGQASVQEFRGSSYPGQASVRGMAPDVNRDGRRDVGMIAEGNFSAVPNGLFRGKPSFHVRTVGGSGWLPGVRDTNQDGRHSGAEWAASKQRGDRLGEILFHRTGNGGGVSSIGCLNIPDLDGFVAAVGGTGASFKFTLVNAHAKEAR